MAGAAGFPLFHLRHGIGFALGSGGKNTVVTIIALVKTDMEGVAEIDFAGIGEIESDIFNADMTSVTAASDTEGNVCVMTGATGEVFLHFSHRIPAATLAAGKNSAMTVNADIHVFCRVSMNLVAEDCRHLLKSDIR